MSVMPETVATDDIAAIAEEAYLYAYPMMVAYGFFHRQAMGPDVPEKQAINRFTHFRTLSSPMLNNTIPWVNTDTLYSAVWLDLRAEPMVLAMPAFEAHRFHDVQANDWYTMAFLVRGTRDVGNAARTYMLAGPDWEGEKPQGVDEVIVCETHIIKLFARVVVEHPGDEAAIHKLQDSYRLEPLSVFEGRPSPPPPPLDFKTPDPAGMRGAFLENPTPAFIGVLNDLMRYAKLHPSEEALFVRFARIGVKPGAPFDAEALSTAQAAEIQRGIDAGLARIAARLAHLDDPINGWVYPLDLRGGRDVLAGSPRAYLCRAVLAKYAIWGPPAEEVVYMTADTDVNGARLDGSKSGYTLTFDRAPPAKGFWSFTVYDSTTRLLSPHPSGRYKLGDRDKMAWGADGSLTLYVQNEQPEVASNWLPVPPGPFQVVGRLYWPEAELLDHRYKPPALIPT
jgi:hypothetical protein